MRLRLFSLFIALNALTRSGGGGLRSLMDLQGMLTPDEVAIILPVYRTERLDEIWRRWSQEFDGFARHANTAFDLHLYHCFGTWWQRQGLANQIRMTKRHKKILRRVPAVIGEWSLALAPEARGDGPIEEDQ